MTGGIIRAGKRLFSEEIKTEAELSFPIQLSDNQNSLSGKT
jgi:hypothetical protein